MRGHKQTLLLSPESFSLCMSPLPWRKHFGAAATPAFIEQHLVVKAWGPTPSTEAPCLQLINACCAAFLQKERRFSTAKGELIKKKGILTRRVRKVRSDKGKKHAYHRSKTKTAGLVSAPNARLLERNGEAKMFLAEAPAEAARPSILEELSQPKKRRGDN